MPQTISSTSLSVRRQPSEFLVFAVLSWVTITTHTHTHTHTCTHAHKQDKYCPIHIKHEHTNEHHHTRHTHHARDKRLRITWRGATPPARREAKPMSLRLCVGGTVWSVWSFWSVWSVWSCLSGLSGLSGLEFLKLSAFCSASLDGFSLTFWWTNCLRITRKFLVFSLLLRGALK